MKKYLLLLLLLDVRAALPQPQGPFQPDSLTVALWHMDYLLPDSIGGAFTFYEHHNLSDEGVIPSISGGYVIGVNAQGEENDMDLIRTDNRGVPLRPPRNYGGEGVQCMLDFTETEQGTIGIIGYERIISPYPDVLFMAIDADGNEIGRQTYGDTLRDYGATICAAPEETFLIGGNLRYPIIIDEEEGDYEEHARAFLYQINLEGEILTEFGLQNELRQHPDSYVSDIINTSDQGYLVRGGYIDWDGSFQCLAKYSSDLELEWIQVDNIYSGRGIYEMTQIDSYYFMIGETDDHDIWLKQLDSRGNLIFETAYGTDEWDHGYSLFRTIDGGYAIAGGGYWRRGARHFDMSLIKLSESLQFQWARAWGREEIDFAVNGFQNPDGSFLLFGLKDIQFGRNSIGAIRTSSYQYPGYDYSGNLLNGRQIGTVDTIAGVWNSALSIREDDTAVIEVSDREILRQQTFSIEGWIRPDSLHLGLGTIIAKPFDDQDFSIHVLFDSESNVLTFNVLQAPENMIEVIAQVPRLNNEWCYFGAVCGANSLGLFWNDEKVGEVPFEGDILYSDFPLYIGGGNGDLPAQAQFLGDIDELRISAGVRDYLVLSVPEPSSNIPTTVFLLNASPNPFNSSVTIRFTGGLETPATRLAIYDINGRLVADLLDGRGVLQYAPTAGTHKVVWDASSVGAGVYFVRLEAGNSKITSKLVLVR